MTVGPSAEELPENELSGPATAGKRRIPRSVWLKLTVFVLLVIAGIAAVRATPLGDLLTEDRMRALAGELRQTWWAPLVLIGLFVVLSPLGLPMSPLVVAGAVFGPLMGTIYNVFGLAMGAAVSYQVAKLLGRDFVVHLAGDRLKQAEHAFERHGFWPLVQTRFLPLPFSVVNFGAALAGVKPALFLSSAAVGLIPSTAIHTVFLSALFGAAGRDRVLIGAGYILSFLILNLAVGIPWIREQWRRYKGRRPPE